MKKTLAIVLAVVMAVAALSSFAFIVGGTATKDSFEIIDIFAADIDLAKAGLRDYQTITKSTDSWTPGKSLCIAITFRVYKRALYDYDAIKDNTAYTIVVNSTTADMSFCQYAVPVVASYVSVNYVPQLSYVAQMQPGTVNYVAATKSAAFKVVVQPQSTNVNVLNTPVTASILVSGYVPVQVGTSVLDYAIGVPNLVYGTTDPAFVDYTVFISAKHETDNDGLGDLSACFQLGKADAWVLFEKPLTCPLGVAGEQAYLDGVLGSLGKIDGATLGAGANLSNVPMQNYYKDATAAPASPGGYAGYLDLTSAGYFITRININNYSANGALKQIVRYDVYRYNTAVAVGPTNLSYLISFVTEDLLKDSTARALHMEYNGIVVTYDMSGGFKMDMVDAADATKNIQASTVFPYVIGAADVNGLSWVPGTSLLLTTATPAEVTYIGALTKALNDFGMGVGQTYGYPILNEQFLNAAAAAKFSTAVTNTYIAGNAVAIEATAAAEDTESLPEDIDPTDDIIDDVDLPTAGDATIAFVCAAAAILACAALAFVMKKAR